MSTFEGHFIRQEDIVSDLMRHIGNKIKELRSAGGLTQTDLATALGVTPNTVSRWEGAVNQPSVTDLDRIARILKKPIWALLPSDLEPATEAQQALLSATGDLPPEDLAELLRYADFVRARQTLKKPRKGKAS